MSSSFRAAHCVHLRVRGSAPPVAARNDGPPSAGAKRGKRRAAGGDVPLPDTFSPPPFFFPLSPEAASSFRETRQRRAEPPTSTTLSKLAEPQTFPTKRRQTAPHGRQHKHQPAAAPPFTCEISFLKLIQVSLVCFLSCLRTLREDDRVKRHGMEMSKLS